ncbi:MAG TPA: carboxypeptidase-like regulatory domain-containing protein, partial [Actinoplanes sp.]|nr:carboxypeptidase-like regulatory domain-containing protein [Actinoplanes sp.]
MAVAALAAPVAAPAVAAPRTGSVVVRLADQAGAPVRAADVSVRREPTGDTVAEGVTGADGRFSATDVPAGVYYASIDPPGEKDAEQSDTFRTAPYQLRAGEALVIEEQLLQSVIQGRLTDMTGDPVAQGRARVGAPLADEQDEWADFYSDDLDADGRFSIVAPPGEYLLRFEVSDMHQWSPQARQEAQATTIRLEPGESVTVNETLLPTGSVAGRLTGSGGGALDKATVSLLAADGSSHASTKTNTRGEYQFSYVFPGRYKLAFQPPRLPLQYSGGKLSEDQAELVEVAVGQRTTVDHRMLASGSIAGRLTKPNGSGVAGVVVWVYPLYKGFRNFDADHHTTKTDRTGRYRIAKLPAGSYKVFFEYAPRADSDYGHRGQYAYGKGDWDAARRFTVQPGKTLTVHDKQFAAASMRIIAKDAKTGKRLKNFCVRVEGREKCTTTNLIVLKNVQARRALHVSAEPNSRSSAYLGAQRQAVTLKSGESRLVTMKFRKGGRIRTTVTAAATGRPVSDV